MIFRRLILHRAFRKAFNKNNSQPEVAEPEDARLVLLPQQLNNQLREPQRLPQSPPRILGINQLIFSKPLLKQGVAVVVAQLVHHVSPLQRPLAFSEKVLVLVLALELALAQVPPVEPVGLAISIFYVTTLSSSSYVQLYSNSRKCWNRSCSKLVWGTLSLHS